VQQVLDEEKSKHASLAQQNGFGPTFWQRKLMPKQGTLKPNTCAVDCLGCLTGPGWLLLVVSYLLQSQF
jgi:hypothetical protein